MGFLSDLVNVGTLGLVGDGPLSFAGEPAQGGTVTPSQAQSFSAGTLAPSRAFNQTGSFGLNKSLQDIYGPQAQALNPFFGFTGGLLDQYRQDPASLISGFTDLQRQGQQAALTAPTQNIFEQASRGFGEALQTDPSQNPFFQSALQSSLNPFIRNFTQSILPNIRSQAVGVGQPGGSREGIAQGMAVQGLLGQLGDITARMGSNAFGQGLQARQNALGFAPQLAGLGMMPAQTMMDIGGQQQALEQQRLLAPFMLGQNIQGLLGAPITLGQSMGQTGAFGRQGSVGAITGPSFSTSTGATTHQTAGKPGVLDIMGKAGLSMFAPGSSVIG